MSSRSGAPATPKVVVILPRGLRTDQR